MSRFAVRRGAVVIASGVPHQWRAERRPFCLFAARTLCYRADFAGSPSGVPHPSRAVYAIAGVAELVDAPDLGSGDFGRGGSSPFARTTANP